MVRFKHADPFRTTYKPLIIGQFQVLNEVAVVIAVLAARGRPRSQSTNPRELPSLQRVQRSSESRVLQPEVPLSVPSGSSWSEGRLDRGWGYASEGRFLLLTEDEGPVCNRPKNVRLCCVASRDERVLIRICDGPRNPSTAGQLPALGFSRQ